MTKYQITNGNNTKTYSSKRKAQDAAEALPGEIDVEPVETDGGTDTMGKDGKVETPVDERPEGHTEVVETSPESEPVADNAASGENLPDRSLTEDPIDWLAQGSDEFVTSIKGTPVITKKGFRVLQHKYDISTTSEVVVGPEETDHEFARVKATAKMPDGRSAEAHASASTDRGDDSYLLTSMADTRAKSRALSDVTGVGAVAVEEMMGVEE